MGVPRATRAAISSVVSKQSGNTASSTKKDTTQNSLPSATKNVIAQLTGAAKATTQEQYNQAQNPEESKQEQQAFYGEDADRAEEQETKTSGFYGKDGQNGSDRYGAGNIDLYDRDTKLYDNDGNLMTVRSISVGEDGKEVLIPTIVKQNGKWTQLSDDEAVDWYHKTGEHLGKFDSIDEANDYAERLHQQQASLYANPSAQANPGENPYDPEADADFVDLFATDGKPAANGREAAEKAAQWKALGGTPAEKKAQARERADQYEKDLGNLQSERLYKEQLGTDQKTLADYDQQIQELADKIKAEQANINTTDKERDELIERYNNAVNAEDLMAGYVTDPLSQMQAEEASAARKALEEQLKEKNRALGNDVYFGLADQAQERDLFEGWAGERAAGTAAALGTGLEWIGDKTNSTGLETTGQELFEAAQGWQGQAQSDWESGTEDMSELGQQAAGLSKTAADMTMDMIDNFIIPGSGRVAMAARVGGQGALTQGEREKNDVDARIAKAALDGGAAFLSEYLLGGAEQVYGKSIIGKAIGNATARLPKGVQNVIKVFMNTEGAEEGLEYGLSYLGDKILELENDPQFEWDEFKQNVAVGYLMGVLFNGVAAGIEYDGPKIKRAVDEGFNGAINNMSPEEITRAATLQPNDDVKIKTGQPKAEAEPIAGTEAPAQTQQTEPTPVPVVTTETEPMQTSTNPVIARIQERMTISPKEVSQIRNNPQLRADFEAAYGISLDGMGERAAAEAIRNAVVNQGKHDRAINQFGEIPEAMPSFEPGEEGPSRGQREFERDTERWDRATDDIARILAGDDISRRDATRIMTEPAMWQAFQEATGIDLSNKGRTEQNVREAFMDAKNPNRQTQATIEPQAQPEPDTSTRYDNLRGIEARDTVTDILNRAENGWVGPEEAQGILNNPDMLDAYCVLQGVSEADARGELQDIVNEARRTESQSETPAQKTNATEQKTNATDIPKAQSEPQQTTAQPQPDVVDNLLGTEPQQNQNTQQANQEQTGGTQLNWNVRDGAPGGVSEVYSNTYTKTGEAKLLNETDFVKYPISEQQSIQRAAAKIAKDYDAVLADLYGSRQWLSEQVDAAWLIRDKLLAEAMATNNKDAWAAYDKFAKVTQEHGSELGDALHAFAKQSRPGAASVLDVANKRIDAVREASKNSKAKDAVSEEVLERATNKTREVATKMAKLEYEVDQKIESGMSEEEAKQAVKERYLDLIDEINLFRHTGLFQDAKAMSNERSNRANIRQAEVNKLNTKFRKMLEGESLDYIMRFAACDAKGISDDVNYKGKQDFLKRLNTWQKLAQLTGTGTWLRNGVGTGSFGIVDVFAADNPATVLADMFVSAKTGKRSSGFETGILNKHARDTAAHALNRSVLEIAANIDLAPDADMTKYDMGRTRTYDPASENIMERLGSRWEQWNGYMLQSSDAMFKGMAEGSAETAIRNANKWGDDNLTDAERSSMPQDKAEALSKKRQAELDETKKQIAEYRAFQNSGVTATAANEIRDWLNKKGAAVVGKEWQKGQFGLGTALMPYTKVPANLAVKSLEFSPAGMLKGMIEMGKVMTDPNATMAQQNKAVTDFGRGATGTIIIAALAHLMKDWPFFKDWDAEDDKDVKAQNRAEGKYGMEINLTQIGRWLKGDKSSEWQNGDRTLDISSMEPLNQLLATASLIAEQEEFSLSGASQAFWESSRDSVLNMPALQTLSNIENNIRYTDTPEEGWKTAFNTLASTAGNVVGGLNPAPIRRAASLIDDKVRDTSGNTPVERAWNQVVSGIPVARETLPAKTDAYGNEMTSGDFATRFANQYDSFKHTQVNQSDVSREVERLREATGESHVPARNGPKSIQFGSGADAEKVKLTTDERNAYKNAEGQDFDRAMQILMEDPVYQLADDATKEQMMAAVEGYSKDTAKGDLANKKNIEFESEYADIRELPDPAEVLAAKTGLDLAKKEENWDAVDSLLDVIRGNQGSDGKLSQDAMDYLTGKDSKLNYYMYLGDKGIPTQRAKDFEADMKALYTSEARDADRASDWIRTAGNGNYTAKEADAIMAYESEVSKEAVDRYQRQVKYNLGEAGKSGLYDEVWRRIEMVKDGELDKDVFKRWVRNEAKDPANRSGIPAKYGEQILDICSTYTGDNHVAGVYATAFYDAARSIGCTPEQALQFYNKIDSNYNGSYSKGEIDAAVAWAFGYDSKYKKRYYGNTYTYYNFSGDAKKVRDYILKNAGR